MSAIKNGIWVILPVSRLVHTCSPVSVPFMSLEMNKAKELVTLRRKPLSNGGESLFLDYSIGGVRRKEYLGMYIVPERTKIDRLQNVETMKTAMALKARRTVDLQNGAAGLAAVPRTDTLLSAYGGSLVEKYRRRGSGGYAGALSKTLRWAEMSGDVPLRGVDRGWLLRFLQRMRDGGLSEGTVYMNWMNLSTVFNSAVRDGLVPESPFRRVGLSEKPRPVESVREYLTLEEVGRLRDTPCRRSEVKEAFLFSCFTGLRFSDVASLTWDRIRRTDLGRRLEARQHKTGAPVYVPLSRNAEDCLPEQGDGLVWRLPSHETVNGVISSWVEEAGIRKHITFHCARHTYATLLLTYGADIYTVSKLLGHSDIGTTQIYAKIVDRKKQEAVNLIPDI